MKTTHKYVDSKLMQILYIEEKKSTLSNAMYDACAIGIWPPN